MLQQLAVLAYILLVYHAFAFFGNYALMKSLLCSGHRSILFAILNRDLMSGMVKGSITKAVKHAIWCIALVILMIMI